MKQIERLKLNQLSKDELKKRELNYLKGGNACCECCCGYVAENGISTAENGATNLNAGYTQSYGDVCYCGVAFPMELGSVC